MTYLTSIPTPITTPLAISPSMALPRISLWRGTVGEFLNVGRYSCDDLFTLQRGSGIDIEALQKGVLY